MLADASGVLDMSLRPVHGMLTVLAVAGVGYGIYWLYQQSKIPFTNTCNNYKLPPCMGVSSPNCNGYNC